MLARPLCWTRRQAFRGTIVVSMSDAKSTPSDSRCYASETPQGQKTAEPRSITLAVTSLVPATSGSTHTLLDRRYEVQYWNEPTLQMIDSTRALQRLAYRRDCHKDKSLQERRPRAQNLWTTWRKSGQSYPQLPRPILPLGDAASSAMLTDRCHTFCYELGRYI